MDNTKVITRDEIKIEDTWKMEDMFASDQAWEEEYKATVEKIPRIKEYMGKVSKDKEALIEYLNLDSEIGLAIERLYVYANQKYHEDMAVSKYQAFSGKAQKLMIDANGLGSFFNPEILEMEESVLREWLEDERLKDYRRGIELTLREKEHTLDQNALAAACVTDDADELILGVEILLGDLAAQSKHTGVAAGRKVNTVQMGRGGKLRFLVSHR